METEGEFRYCVVPGEKGLALPDPKTNLSGWIQEQEWSWALEESIDLLTGETAEAPTLEIHVGEWPVAFDDRKRRQTAEYARRMHVEKQLWVEANVFQPLCLTGKNEASGPMQNRREAERVERTADPTAHWSGPEGLGAILESGGFEVEGHIYFAPLMPFQPDPRIPSSMDEARQQNMSFERLRFIYPK